MIRTLVVLLIGVCCSWSYAADGEAQHPYSDAELFSRGQMREYTGEHLEAVSFPVGGVGTGSVHIDGRGIRHGWMIFSRYWLESVPPDKPRPTAPHYVSRNKRIPCDEPKPMPWYMSYVPDSFFAVRVARGEGTAAVRVLQTVGEGEFKPVERLSLRAAYPLAWYEFHDDALSVRVSMRTWNPLIPCELKNSAIPCAIYDFTVENPTDQPLDVALLATQQNSAGLTGRQRSINGTRSGGLGKNVNRIVRSDQRTLLHMTAEIDEAAEGYGDMTLATPNPSAGITANVSTTAEWHDATKLHADFRDDGHLAGPDEAGPTSSGTVNGAIAQSVTLAPGEKRTITFVLTWHFPNARHGGGKSTDERPWLGQGNYYTNWWPTARAVAADVLERYEELEARTLAYQRTLYETNLPYWMLQRISSQVAPIRTRTVWWDKEGYFGAWEGMSAGTGSCPGNCNHVWHYAQAYARLLPDLARRMREQEIGNPKPDGGLLYRQTTLPPPSAAKVKGYPATDGQLGVVLGCYREYLTSPGATGLHSSADSRGSAETPHPAAVRTRAPRGEGKQSATTWLAREWPRIRGAMQFVIDTWDKDGDGALSGIQHTTLDCKVGGSTSWLGSMYLAALRACEDMARIVGDQPNAAEYRKLHRSGSRMQRETLFNGEYFIQYIEGAPEDLPDYYTQRGYRHKNKAHPAFIGGQNYFDGCAIDQLLGQWWAWQLDLGELYPADDIRTALKSLYRYNYVPKFAGLDRASVQWVDPDDGGMVVVTYPHGPDQRLKGKKPLGYGGCTLTGFEYAAAAVMIRAGLLREGFTVVKTVSDRYDGRLRVGLHRTTWGHSGNPFGDDESGKWYARAQSAWSLLLVAQGFIHDGPRGVIGFDPTWKPEEHRSLFTAAEGFGLFTQRIDGEELTASIAMRDGRLAVTRIVLHVPKPVDVDGNLPVGASVFQAGRRLLITVETDGRRVELTLREPLTLQKGETLEAELTWSR